MSSVTSPKEMNHRIARRLGVPAIVATLVLGVVLGPISTIRPVKAANGDVDTSYGLNGIVALPSPNKSVNPQAAIQPDGKVVVAYNRIVESVDGTPQSYSLVVVRFLPNGEPDPYGAWPKVVLLEEDVHWAVNPFIDIIPTKVLIRPDGKILVAYSNRHQKGIAAVLLHSNGTIDTSFSTAGIDGRIFLGEILDLEVLPDNQFVTLGTRYLRRFSANGLFISVVEAVFPEGGIGNNSDCLQGKLAVTPDGRVIAATFDSCAALKSSLLRRYNADLSLDASFCGGSYLSYCAFPTWVFTGIDVASDGKIVAMADGVVMRRLSDGSVDTSFGDSGFFTLSSTLPPFPAAFKVDSLNRIVVKNRHLNRELWVIAADGSTAEEFAAPVVQPFSPSQILLQEDGKVIVVDQTGPFVNFPSYDHCQLVRFHYDDQRKAADLRTKINPATGINPGGEIEYTIRVTNDGPDKAGHVTFENPVPDGTRFVSFEAPEGWVIYQRPNTFSGFGKVSCSGLSLESGQIATFRLTVRLKANTPRGSQILNTSTVKSLVPDPVPLNNVSTATVIVQ